MSELFPPEQPGFPIGAFENFQGVKVGKEKPPYRIPLMSDINQIQWNGLKVCSLFAGGGGSSTGYKMAGYKVIWANEFEKNPQTTYRANYPDTILNTQDIKKVTAQDILFNTKLKVGELDILDGSPPCQGFSIANKNRLKRKVKIYDNGHEQVNEDLFFEYVRILKGLMPRVFVAENVKGLTMGGAKSLLGDFNLNLFDSQDETILHSLMNCGYVVRWQILNAADYGTPQNRQRVFFIGVRKDLNLEPMFPVKFGYQYVVSDALPHLSGDSIHWSDLAGQGTSPEINKDKPSPCITKRGYKDSGSKTYVKLVNGDVGGHSERRGHELKMDKPITAIMAGDGRCGRGKTQFQIVYGCNTTGKPTKPNLPGNTFLRDEKVGLNVPIRTVTKSGAGCGGVSCMIESDEGRRKFTIAELKRLGGFPDDYILTGFYSSQWSIIGNSVCPPQMMHLAKCIKETIFDKL